MTAPQSTIGELGIELGEAATPHPCACCGKTTHMVYGLVYRRGHAYAVYLASWSEGHQQDGVRLAVSIGRWDEGSQPMDRQAIGLTCHVDDRHLHFDVVEPAASPWQRLPVIGALMAREQALAHPHFEAYLDVARFALAEDPRAVEFLAWASGTL